MSDPTGSGPWAEWAQGRIAALEAEIAEANKDTRSLSNELDRLRAENQRLRAKLNRIYAQARQAIGAQSRQRRLTEHLANQEAADE